MVSDKLLEVALMCMSELCRCVEFGIVLLPSTVTIVAGLV